MALDAKGGTDVAWVGAGVFLHDRWTEWLTLADHERVPLGCLQKGLADGLDTIGNITLLWPNPPDDTHLGGTAFQPFDERRDDVFYSTESLRRAG